MELIKELFAIGKDIYRPIEEVIKVDQIDEQIVKDEIEEYITTKSIEKYYASILDRYWETPNKPHEGIGVWVSGFFGSGKSSFAKMLGVAIGNKKILAEDASELFCRRIENNKIKVLVKSISEKIPTETVVFDLSSERGIRTGSQTIYEIMYKLFLQQLGYAKDIDLAELEILLEDEGRLEKFKITYQKIYKKDWDKEKNKVAFAIQEASRIMNELEPDTYTTADSWRESAMKRTDITPASLAERCKELMGRRRPGKTLAFIIDEVGQFVARDVQKMLDLQGVVQNLGRVGRGKMWLIVTSQEKLTELVDGLEGRRAEISRLMDRFPSTLQVHLEPSDISEVTSRRVLSKNAEAQKLLRELFNKNRGSLMSNTKLSADIRLPELSAENFVELYPLLPYQIDLIINVVSGLRTQGGAAKHVGGANRTIIKLAQQLLVHPDSKINLADKPIGTLACIDQIYDLVKSNISSEIRGKIDEIKNKVTHPLAQQVAKAICLLQFVKSIHRTAENIAAALHPSVDADTKLPEVKEAIDALKKSLMIREGDDGYRIPTPAEDDWERQRASLPDPRPGDVNRLFNEIIESLWKPQPSYNFLETKSFKAGLFFNNKPVIEGDMPFHLGLAQNGSNYDEQIADFRSRSQSEKTKIFWIAKADAAVDREVAELHRSNEILSRKSRGTLSGTGDESNLIAEEKQRKTRHQEELRRLIKTAFLSGTIFFRGNDRSPGDTAAEIKSEAERVLKQTLPDVYYRFQEAAARIQKKDLELLMSTENLRGLTASDVFKKLKLIIDQNGSIVFNVESDPLAEIQKKIENLSTYGENPTGRYLTDEFEKEPFGWEFDAIRLFTVCLLRAGKIEATSKGAVIDSVTGLEANSTIPNNNFFRQMSFRPKVGIEFKVLIDTVQAFKNVFGKDIPEIEQNVIAEKIREELGKTEQEIQETHTTLISRSLPGAEVLKEALDQIRAIRSGKESNAILTFKSSYNLIKEAIKRSAALKANLTEDRLFVLEKAMDMLKNKCSFLSTEMDIDESILQEIEKLRDVLSSETFFKEFSAIDQTSRKIEAEYERRFNEALEVMAREYTEAINRLKNAPEWGLLNDEQQQLIVAPLETRTVKEPSSSNTIPLMRADIEACPGRFNKSVEETMRIIDGQRVVKINVADYFVGGIETAEQLDSALDGLREKCEQLIGSGKKILLQ